MLFMLRRRFFNNVGRIAIACLTAALSCVALPALATAKPASNGYVALGDSYTTGPFIPDPTGPPVGCFRSTNNYPHITARTIRPSEFKDVSCSAARTYHMEEPQPDLPFGQTNPPQFDALHPGVGLVTLGIGGNDMGFGVIIDKCIDLAFDNGGRGRPCTDHYNRNGFDEIKQTLDRVVAPRVARVIQGIHARSPNARALVVGYPDPVPRGDGCFPWVPFARGDLPYLHRTMLNLHRTLKRVATENGGEFVDLLTGSAGHDPCQPRPRKWYESVIPTEPAYPQHPNIRGMQFAAREVVKQFRKPVPNDLDVLARRVTRSGRIALTLRVPYRGTVRIDALAADSGGRHVEYGENRELIGRAETVKLGIESSAADRRLLRRRGRVRVRLGVIFDPVAGYPETDSLRVHVGVGRLVIGRIRGVRTARRGRPLRVRVGARGARMRRVRVVLLRRGRVIGRSRRLTIGKGRRRTVRVRVVRRLGRGRLTLRVAGRGAGGAFVRATKRLRIP